MNRWNVVSKEEESLFDDAIKRQSAIQRQASVGGFVMTSQRRILRVLRANGSTVRFGRTMKVWDLEDPITGESFPLPSFYIRPASPLEALAGQAE